MSDGPLKVYRNEPIASSRLDKGDLAKRLMRAAVDAISTWESRIPRSVGTGGSSGSGGSISVGNSGGNKLPPPPPSAPTAPSAPSAPTAGTSVPAPPPTAPPPPPIPGGFVESNSVPNLGVFVVHSDKPETKLHKVTRVVWTVMSRFLLGQQPGMDVIRAIQ